MVKNVIKKMAYRLTSPVSPKKLAKTVFFFVNAFSVNRAPKDSLVFLLELERYLCALTGNESCRYGEGIHSKHRHTRYHDFFTQRLRPEDTVLDIGCGNGALSYDMAMTGAQIVGIDLNADNIAFGRLHFSHPNIEYIHGNALYDLPKKSFDTITLSNVLEHINDRVGFLCNVQMTINPNRWLIRVPIFERDWRVPLMEEVGVDYRSDETHFIEHTKKQFIEELEQAGLQIVYLEVCWGEIWAEAEK